MIEQKQIEIKGVPYRITNLGAKKARTMLVILLRALGPSLGKMSAKNAKDGDFFEKLSSNLREEDFVQVTDTFAAVTEIYCAFGDTAPQWHKLPSVFDVHYAGNMGEMVAWLFECLKENFGDVFQAAAGAGAGKPAADPSTSLPTSTG